MPKMSYNATLMFDKARQNRNEPAKGFSNEFSELKFKSESEERLNKTLYNKLHGTKVKYGHVR